MRQILFSITRPKFSNCLTTDSALSSGEVPTIAALAKTEGVSASYISLKISLAFLAPDILETIIDGMQPMSLTAGAAQEGLPPARFLGRAARLPAGLGKVRHREFAAASGEMTADQFTAFLETAFRNLVANSTDGSIHMVFMDWRHMAEVQAAGGSVYSELKNLIVWVKDNGGMGSFYRSRHELIFVFKNGTAPHVNSFELGQHGRYRTNVWTYKGMNSFGGTLRIASPEPPDKAKELHNEEKHLQKRIAVETHFKEDLGVKRYHYEPEWIIPEAPANDQNDICNSAQHGDDFNRPCPKHSTQK